MKQKLEGSAQEQYVRMLAKSLDGVQKMRIQIGGGGANSESRRAYWIRQGVIYTKDKDEGK